MTIIYACIHTFVYIKIIQKCMHDAEKTTAWQQTWKEKEHEWKKRGTETLTPGPCAKQEGI